MSDKRFDDILKQKLAQHKIPMSGDEWSLMHNMLNENSDFDQLFKERLQEHPIAYEPESWDSLASKLDLNASADTDEKQFDQNLADKLSASTVTYKESHWQLLKEKLEYQKELKQKIAITKVTEVAILVLLLFSFLTIQPFERFTKPSKGPVTVKLQEHTKAQINAQSPTLELVKSNNSEVHSTNSNEAVLADANNNSKTNAFETTLDETNIIANQKIATVNDFVNLRNATQVPYSITHAKNLDHSLEIIPQEEDIQPINTLDINNSKVFDPIRKQSASEGFIEQFPVIQEMINPSRIETLMPFIDSKQKPSAAVSNPAVVSIENSASDLKNLNSTSIHLASIDQREMFIKHHSEMGLLVEPSFAAIEPIKPSKKKGQSWIGFIASLDYNIIDRPLNFKLFLEPEKFGAYGTSFGAQYARTKGHNEFVIGMVRSVKSHDPQQNEVFNVNSSLYDRDFVKQTFDLLQVPIHYKRHLGNLDKLHAYAFAGLNMNFIMFTKFTFENKLLDGEMREDEIISKKSRFDDTVLHKGLFQGGDINKNIFLTADIGVGLEKRINNKSFFLETHFKKNVFASQLGPNKENLNSLSFNIGSRISI